MIEALLDALIDTLKVFVIVYIVYLLVELFEHKFSKKIELKNNRWSPLFGAGFGLIPQCGFSVVATDLYSKKHLTAGTLIAIYISTSDEALPILLSSPSKITSILPLLLSKFVIAVVVGFLIDLILKQDNVEVKAHAQNCTEHHAEANHTGCCNHEIEDTKKHSLAHTLLVHPLVHSLKICGYLLVFNLLFNTLIYFVGEEQIVSFLVSGKGIAPLLSVLVGLIPNCVGSVILTEMYIVGGITFGACLGGLIANAGIAYIVLFKENKNLKENLFIFFTLAFVGLSIGYLFSYLPFLSTL